TLDELKRWDTSGATHPDDLPRVVQAFSHSIASGDPFAFESRARRFDGVYRWFQSRGFPLRDSGGHIVRWYNLLIDIDERKRAEEALAASELNLRQLTETIPEMLWSATAGGAIDYGNARLLEYTGLRAADIRGQGEWSLIHPEDRDQAMRTWR